MNIEKATLENAIDIANIEKICFPPAEAANLESIKQRINTFRNQFFILVDNSKIIGFINGIVTDIENLNDEMYENASLHNENGKWQMIFGIDILPEYQNKGYAGMLMRHFIENAKNENRKGVVLTCKEKLLSFYEHFGFSNEGISQSEHGGGCWYQMRLIF